ncbi:gas vesicle protein GvpJ [Kibdelosporangium lantanae]|uniref:Gas vesicle protein A n=1 Tax=Kibdelosporangium lantanae TaxID=1497396 RepID=A0ABW3MAW9_9PSEU
MTAPAPAPGGLAETLNILLDKGLVIDATVRVSVIGIEILTIEAKIVIASVDTYIRYLEAMQRLDAAKRATNGTIPAPGTQGLLGTHGIHPLMTPPVPAVVTQDEPLLPPPAVEARATRVPPSATKTTEEPS